MTSWAVVVDIWFLDPQTIKPNETDSEFASRVQRMIAARAGIKAVDWDGYMKYWKPSEKFLHDRKKLVGDSICATLGIRDDKERGQCEVVTPYSVGSSAHTSADNSAASSRHSSFANGGGASPRIVELETAVDAAVDALQGGGSAGATGTTSIRGT